MFGTGRILQSKIVNTQKDKFHVFSYMQNQHFRKENMKVEKNLFISYGDSRGRVDGAKTVCLRYTVHMYECHVEVH